MESRRGRSTDLVSPSEEGRKPSTGLGTCGGYTFLACLFDGLEKLLLKTLGARLHRDDIEALLLQTFTGGIEGVGVRSGSNPEGTVVSFQDLFHRTFSLDQSAVKNRNPVAYLFNICQQVTRDENRLSSISESKWACSSVESFPSALFLLASNRNLIQCSQKQNIQF